MEKLRGILRRNFDREDFQVYQDHFTSLARVFQNKVESTLISGTLNQISLKPLLKVSNDINNLNLLLKKPINIIGSSSIHSE